MPDPQRISLVYADRLDALVEPLAARLTEANERAPLKPRTIILPGRAWEGWLTRALADRMPGVAALRFQLLESFVSGLARHGAQGARALGADELTHLIRGCLGSDELLEEDVMEPVRVWLASGREHSERRRVALARELGRLFQEYALSRPGPLEHWSAGRLWDAAAAERSDVEAWQRRLWTEVRRRRDERSAAEHKTWWLPDEVYQRASLGDTLPDAIDVFGASTAAESLLKVFADLARAGVDVHVWALNPCREFWEDVEAGRLVARTEPEGDDPWGLRTLTENPLLRLWGRPGRDFIRRLNLYSDYDFQERFSAPAADRTLLARVRSDVVDRLPARLQDDARADGSLAFVSCAGRRRELEAVAERVMTAVAAPGSDLRFQDVAIVVPDGATDTYLPLVPAVFRRIGEIPWRAVGRRLEASSAWMRLARAVLGLPTGTVDRASVLGIVSHPCARDGIEPARRDTWDRRLDALGVTLGADALDAEGTSLDPTLLHWDQGLRRMARAAFTTAVDDPAARATVEDAADVARLARAVRALLTDVRAFRTGERTLEGWSELARAVLERHLTPRDGDSTTPRTRAIEALTRVAESDVDGTPMAWPGAWSLFDEALAGLTELELRGAAGGVAVGPLSALRGLPFRHIYVVGVMEGELPASHRRSSFDLRETPRLPGDVSPPERDRYALLQVLMAAAERLTITWVGRDPKTGETVQPSPAALELIEVASAYLPNEERSALVTSEAVQSYADTTISERGDADTWDPWAADAAGARTLRTELRDKVDGFALPADPNALADRLAPQVAARVLQLAGTPWADVRAAAAPTLAARERWLSLSALRGFLEHPIQAAARYGLGMMTADREGGEPFAAEPLEISRIDHAATWNRVLARMRHESTLDDALDAELDVLRRAGRAPAGVLGPSDRGVALSALRTVIDVAAEHDLSPPTGWRLFAVGRVDEQTDVDGVGRFDVELAGPDPLRVRLHGLVPLLDARTNSLITVDIKPKALIAPDAPRRFARSVVPAAVAVALGWLQDGVRAVELAPFEGADPHRERMLVFGGVDGARNWLQRLIVGALSPPPAYRFPLSAVYEWLASRESTKREPISFAAALEKSDAGSSRVTWQAGPLDDARRYGGPDEALVPALIAARLSPLFPSVRETPEVLDA